MSCCPNDWILGDDRTVHRGDARWSEDLGWAFARTYCGATALRAISGLPEVALLERCGMSPCLICQTAVAAGSPLLPTRPARSLERRRILPVRIRSDGGGDLADPVKDDF